MKIDLNCDMGESFGRYTIGNDQLVFPYISSCNVACGFHGGDPFHIEQTIEKALNNGVQIGAHPSYPDLQGFGRRYMNIPSLELKSIVKYQIAAIKGMTESLGGRLTYVKPHGALYNNIASHEEEAKTVIEAIQEIDESLAMMGLAGSKIEVIAKQMNIRFIAEAFADRKYTADGKLMSRSEEGAVLVEPNEVANQVLTIVKNQAVMAENKTLVRLQAESICIHGDNPNVVEILKATHEILKENKIKISAF